MTFHLPAFLGQAEASLRRHRGAGPPAKQACARGRVLHNGLVPLLRTIGLLLLAALGWAGCATPSAPLTVAPPPITEVVVVPEPRAPARPSELVAAPEAPVSTPIATNQAPAPGISPVQTNRPAVAPAAPVNRYAGRQWIPLTEWCASHQLQPPRRAGSGAATTYQMATPCGPLILQMDSRIAHCGGAQCWLGFNPRILQGQPCLHVLDAEKTLDPLLRRPAALSKAPRVIVIDPGHGGRDGGVSQLKVPLEKNYALDWALRLRDLLQTNGWRVVLTRSNDTDIALSNRISVADHAGADLYVSLHFNSAFPYVSHKGIETYCSTPRGMASHLVRNAEDDALHAIPNNPWDEENMIWAWRLHRELLAATQASDGGVRRTRYMKVLRDQRRPAVLIEGGYLSNATELQHIATPAYRQALAVAVARALE